MDPHTQKINNIKYIFDIIEGLLMDAENYEGYAEGEFVSAFILNVLTRNFENCKIPESLYICFNDKAQCEEFMLKQDSCLMTPGEESEVCVLGHKCYRRFLLDDYDDKILQINFVCTEEYIAWDIFNDQVKYIPSEGKIRSFSLSLSEIYSDAIKNTIRLSEKAIEILSAGSEDDDYIKHFTKNYSHYQNIYYGQKVISIPTKGNLPITEKDVIKYFSELCGKSKSETCNDDTREEVKSDKNSLQITETYVIEQTSRINDSNINIISQKPILKHETNKYEKEELRNAVDFLREEAKKRSLFIDNYSISKDNILSAYHNRYLESSQNEPLMNILSQID